MDAQTTLDFTTLSDDQRWQAHTSRDRRFDGVFITAVHSTGIYCRPSCSARTPLRKNVSFYPTPSAAEADGFRPCKRCEPEKRPSEVELVEGLCRFIDSASDHPLTLADLSEQFHASESQIHRVFKRILGITPRQYLDSRRLEAFTTRLREGDSVTDALYESGYGSSSRVYEKAHRHIGMTPGQYQKGGEGLSIVYTLNDSPLGRLLVAATERGVCAISISDEDRELEAFLHTEFPAADIRPGDDAVLSEFVTEVITYLEGTQPHLDLPLDIRATAFQHQVLEALRDIPYGETRTYSEVAEHIGKPKAVRAVANACATNRVALAIPCHRVTRKDGKIGGYRWGTERKESLLRMEGDGKG